MIYIAGNEPFNKGPVNYQEVCALARGNEVLVNTIYCGDHMQGVRKLWKDGAIEANGEDDLGTVINKSILNKAIGLGFDRLE